MRPRLPTHWSEWLLAAMILVIAVKVLAIDMDLWHGIQRNGGFVVSIKELFGS